ncbi:hypothetical protein ZWY2020_039692 [Hordeum vulgare]|nr:hypothetical protein ZWY2020_039692 [Hordeum vulgare]
MDQRSLSGACSVFLELSYALFLSCIFATVPKVPDYMAAKAGGAVQVHKNDTVKRTAMARRGLGREGKPIRLLSNHFAVKLSGIDAVFYQYSVSIKSDDDQVVEGKGIGRKVIDKMLQTYSSELAGKDFAYDGEKCLFTVGPLPQNNFEFTVIMEETSARAVGGSPGHESPGPGDKKRVKRSHLPKQFVVGISYSKDSPQISCPKRFKGDSDHARIGCLLVRQSFFSDDSRNLVDLTGGVSGCRGLHSSFRTTMNGLSLNMDVSTTMIVTPGPVVNFLLTNQNVRDIRDIDWPKAKRMLKNLRVKATHNNMEFKIIGLSDQPCSRQTFPMKVRSGSSEGETVDITVEEYFKSKQVFLEKPYLPCLDKPQDRMRVVTDAVKSNRYDDDPIFSSCGIKIDNQLTRVDGRVLPAPMLVVGNSQDCVPFKGRWNYNNKYRRWAIVNFSARCDMSRISRDLINCGRTKGIIIEGPYSLVDEDNQARRCAPIVRVERMFEKVKANLPGPPEFLLCVLPERKNCDIYGPWKKKNLHEMGIVTQCIVPSTKMNDQYFTNVLLKINAKLGGMNSKLALEHSRTIPVINKIPTIILGMDVSHGSPGRSDIPSIAAMLATNIATGHLRTQSPKVEMIDSLFKPLDSGKDDGIIRELLLDFYTTSQQRKPEQIIIFRDGVSESQFSQVLNLEVDQIIKVVLGTYLAWEALGFLEMFFFFIFWVIQAFQKNGQGPTPKITVIIAQKNHHETVPRTVVDSGIVHPKQYDFYMCAHAGPIGTSRPTHYHVLLDQIGFTPDELQKLVLSLSYVYQRSTTAISVVAPICAHLAAAQMSQFIKFEEFADTSSGSGVPSSSTAATVPELPRLHSDVCSSMFFC